MQPSSYLSHGISSVVVALNVLDELGLPSEACLRHTGITQEMLADPDGTVTLPQEIAFYRNVLAKVDDPFVGLRIGSEYHLGNYGMWGFAMMSASSLRETLDIALRFLDLTFTFFDYELNVTAAEVVITIDPLGDYGTCLPLLCDREISAAHALLGQVLDRVLPLTRVSLTHGNRESAARYRDHYNCAITMGAPRSEFAFARDLLDARPPGNNPSTADFCVRQCEVLIARLGNTSTLVNEIRQRLLLQPGHFPQIDEIAREMGVSPRSLRRHLAEESSSYRTITDEVRFELAKEYLEETALPVASIAALIGYAEPASFSHAFKRWAGMTPRTYRDRHERSVGRPATGRRGRRSADGRAGPIHPHVMPHRRSE